MQNKRMNLRLFEDDVNIIDRTGAETSDSDSGIQ